MPRLDARGVVEISTWNELEKIKDRIKQALVKEFNITHSTLEFEHPDYKHEGAHTYGHGQQTRYVTYLIMQNPNEWRITKARGLHARHD